MEKILYFEPSLTRSPFSHRIREAMKRLTERYPCDNLDFLLIDLEHPVDRVRHAHQCTTDLTGRTVEFLAEAHRLLPGLDDSFLHALYHRMTLFGPTYGFARRYFPYYRYTHDPETLRIIRSITDEWIADYRQNPAHLDGYGNGCCCYTEGLAELYHLTGDPIYAEIARPISRASLQPYEGAHGHGLLCTVRAMLKMAYVTGDESQAQGAGEIRDAVLRNMYPDGSVSEGFPRSHRNEGCAIGDWVMTNLRYFDVYGDESALEVAEFSLLNALFFNQFITGGFGHRNYEEGGYSTEVEEAWWCCTQTGGIAICEFAEHAVMLRDGKIVVNYPVPGVYTLQGEEGPIRVTLTSEYPATYSAHLTVEGAGGREVAFRIPSYARGAEQRAFRSRTAPDRLEIEFTSHIGHYAEQRDGGWVMKYGPLVLAPMIYSWEHDRSEYVGNEANIPDGYAHDFAGKSCEMSILEPKEKDEYGFWQVAAGRDLPEWLAFDDGVGSPTGTFFRAPANVTLVSHDGTQRRLCFQPLCYATSNLTLCHTPIRFGLLAPVAE